MGLIERLLAHFGFHRQAAPAARAAASLPADLPTFEIFARPGHGRTSFLWAALFMLRKLNVVWPDYLCWPQDGATDEALKGILQRVHEGLLPSRSAVVGSDAEGAADDGTEPEAMRFLLVLHKMERWGDKGLAVWDRADPVFSPPARDGRAVACNWTAPAFWLVSLADLAEVEIEFLDMLFDNLVLARVRQGYGLRPKPFQLVVVLTKADAIPNLPLALRTYLKDDPLWHAVSGEVTLATLRQGSPAAVLPLGPDQLKLYLGTLWRVHQEIQAWLDSTLSGHMLIRRAAEHHVELRFALISATGSGIASGQSLAVPWCPRRVLDPLFWAFELAAHSP
ncbi:MAG TPA: hypothetical protein VMW75_12280 [Thermoanaerobaculia bacterium]|nr:hypothetical protein [Thermoanaerobaculia bacterium]